MSRIRVAHCSMQVSDTPDQQRLDARILFRRGYDWITGTEAGPASPLASTLRQEAQAAGYRFYKAPGGSDVWIAVSRAVITGGWETSYRPIIDGVAGKYAGKGLITVGFDTDHGRIGVGAAHFLLRGDPRNSAITHAIGAWGRDVGKGRGLAFFGGDFNTNDRDADVFRGAPFTTAADELHHWENTGHGPIDGIASFDPDKRVRAVSFRVLDDRELHLFTDHYLLEAVYEIGAAA